MLAEIVRKHGKSMGDATQRISGRPGFGVPRGGERLLKNWDIRPFSLCLNARDKLTAGDSNDVWEYLPQSCRCAPGKIFPKEIWRLGPMPERASNGSEDARLNCPGFDVVMTPG